MSDPALALLADVYRRLGGMLPTETSERIRAMLGDHDDPEPTFLVSIEQLAHVREFGGSGWSWRCTGPYSTLDAGYVHGDCRYDHNVDTRPDLVAAIVAHLAQWHGIRPTSGAQ